MGWSSLISPLVPSKMFSSFMHPERGYEDAQEELKKSYAEGQAYLQPYNKAGQEALGPLTGAMNNLLNPSSLMDQFMNQYRQSDASKFAQGRAKESGLNAASSMGLMGSTPALQALQYGQSEIGAQDEQRFIERMIQQYLSGAGIAQNIYGQGAQTAGQMGNNAMGFGGANADMAFGKRNAPGKMFGDILGTVAGFAGAGAGGGAKGWSTMGGK